MEIQLQKTKHKQINEMISQFEQDHLIHFRQAHRMIDLFETIIKTNTAILLANYFHVNKISDEVAKKLVQGMRTPSLGTWLGFNEVVFEQLAYNHVPKDVFETIYHSAQPHDCEKMDRIYKEEKNTYVFRSKKEQGSIKGKGQFLERIFSNYYRNHHMDGQPFTSLVLPAFYTDYRAWHNMASNKIVKFRNEYAHGATPTEEECLQDIHHHLDQLHKSLSLSWLHETSVIVFSEDLQTLEVGNEFIDIAMLQLDKTPEPHIPYLVLPDNSLLRLFPIVTYQPITRENKQSISFFNDLKGMQKNEISYLNYPYAEHIRDDEIYARFIEVFRLEEWRKNLLNEFEDLMLRLQESFKGRTDELAYLQTFVERNNRGFLYIYGIPGIGKSALIANAFLEPNEKQKVIKYFVRNRRYTHITDVLDYLNRTIDQMYRQQIQLSIGLGDTEEEKRKLLHERLQHVTRHLVSNDEKLIIIVDGLDEGDQALLNNLIFETYANVLVIYVARQTPEVTAFINDLPLDYLTKKEIGKINSEDIRAMLYEVVNKYNITESYVQAIAEKSDGHPLYVRLLCDALIEYPEKLNDEHYLPEKWEEFYKRFIDRFIDDEHGQVVLEGLFVFAAAKDYLSKDQMRFILRNNAQQNLIIFNRLSELLIESLEQREHYQLFHETFHEYIIDQYAFDVMDAEEKILNYCMRWDSLHRFGDSMLLYPLQHLSAHLRDNNDLAALETLVHHEKFIDQQLKTTRKFTASFMLLEAYRSVAYEQENETALIDAMVQLIKLNERLRNTGLADEQNIVHWTIDDWKRNLQNLHFYDQIETGRQLFVNLWDSLERNDSELEQITIEIDRVLPNDTNVFNWVEYVPISLLVHLSVQLKAKRIDPAFILNRIATVEVNVRDVLNNYPLTELSAPILRVLINHVIYPDFSPWSSLMVHLIIRLHDQQLNDLAVAYKKELKEYINNSYNRYVDEQSWEPLAKYYINNGLEEKGFIILSKIQHSDLKLGAYRRLYELYEASNRFIAERAYRQGIDILKQFEGDNRVRYLVEWLPITFKENKAEHYDQFILEIEQAINHNEFELQFGGLEDMAKHYWNIGKYESVMNTVEKMAHIEGRHELYCELYALSETDINCPAPIKQTLQEKFSQIENNLFTNEEVWLAMYDNVIEAVVARWIQLDQDEEIHQLLAQPAKINNQSKLFKRMLDEYYQNDGIDKVVEFAFTFPYMMNNHYLLKEAVHWFLQRNYKEEMYQVIERIEEKQDIEEIIQYVAIEALKLEQLDVYQSLFTKLKNPVNRQLLTFELVYTYGYHCRWDEALQLLKEVREEMPVTETIPYNYIDELTVQRLINQGNINDAFQITNDESLKERKRFFVEEAIHYHQLRYELAEAFAHYDRTFNILPHIDDIDFYQHDIDLMITRIVMKMGRMGNRDVIGILEKVDNSSLQLSIRVAYQFNQQGMLTEANQIVDQYKAKLTKEMDELQNNPVALYHIVLAYCNLANYYVENGDTVKAESILRTIIDDYLNEQKTEKQNSAVVYFTMAYECRKQQLDDLLKIVENKYKSLVNNQNISSIWFQYIKLLIRDHQFDKAIVNFNKTSFKSSCYENLIFELMFIQDTDTLLEVYKMVQSERFTEFMADYLINQKAIVRYLLDIHEEEKMYGLIQSEQNVYNRIQLYEEILPGITKETLSLFLNKISQEQSDVKRLLERKVLYHSVIEPNFTAKQLHEIMSTLTVEKETTTLALYVYRTFKKRKFDDSIDDAHIQTIDEVLRIE